LQWIFFHLFQYIYIYIYIYVLISLYLSCVSSLCLLNSALGRTKLNNICAGQCPKVEGVLKIRHLSEAKLYIFGNAFTHRH
jgi:hypothetical protein